MELNDKVTQLEDEIKILKNEIQAVLLDLREGYLNNKNPFNAGENPQGNVPPAVPVQPAPMQTVPAFPEVTKDDISVRQINTLTANESLDLPVEPTLEPEVFLDDVQVDVLDRDQNSDSRKYSQNRKESISTENTVPVTEKATKFPSKEWRTIPAGNIFGGFNQNAGIPNENICVGSMTKLCEWVEESGTKLGEKRTGLMLDVAEMMGYLSADVKAILEKLITREANGDIKSDARDYLGSWIKLATILGKENKPEIALFYMVCQEAENR